MLKFKPTNQKLKTEQREQKCSILKCKSKNKTEVKILHLQNNNKNKNLNTY